MATNKKAPARSKTGDEYILTTKLFCGKCREMMTGYGGTSRNGKVHRYYACNNAKKKLCDKKIVGKEYIENLVIAKCRELLTDENIDIIAKEVVKVSEHDRENSNVRRLEKLLKENEKAVDNLLRALETGAAAEQITARIQEKTAERTEIEKQLATENTMLVKITVPQVKFFLTQIRDGDANDIKYRKALVTALVNKIYLYDDKITFILNAGNQPVEVTEELLTDIEAAGGGVQSLTTAHHHNRGIRTPPSKEKSHLRFLIFLRQLTTFAKLPNYTAGKTKSYAQLEKPPFYLTRLTELVRILKIGSVQN